MINLIGGKIIETTQGYWVLVDFDDYDELSQYSWSVQELNRDRPTLKVYAQRARGDRTITMHRQIMGEPDEHVDHINQCTWDNRRKNLRAVTQAENNRNRSDLYINHCPHGPRANKPFIVRRNGYPQKSFKTIKEARVYRDTLLHG